LEVGLIKHTPHKLGVRKKFKKKRKTVILI
jgi:hypothetical protein